MIKIFINFTKTTKVYIHMCFRKGSLPTRGSMFYSDSILLQSLFFIIETVLEWTSVTGARSADIFDKFRGPYCQRWRPQVVMS